MIEGSKISQVQTERIVYVSEELGLSKALARGLLIKNRWETQTVIDAVLTSEDYVRKEFNFTLEAGKKRIA